MQVIDIDVFWVDIDGYELILGQIEGKSLQDAF